MSPGEAPIWVRRGSVVGFLDPDPDPGSWILDPDPGSGSWIRILDLDPGSGSWILRKANIAIKNCFRVETPEIAPMIFWTAAIRTRNVVQPSPI